MRKIHLHKYYHFNVEDWHLVRCRTCGKEKRLDRVFAYPTILDIPPPPNSRTILHFGAEGVDQLTITDEQFKLMEKAFRGKYK